MKGDRLLLYHLRDPPFVCKSPPTVSEPESKDKENSSQTQTPFPVSHFWFARRTLKVPSLLPARKLPFRIQVLLTWKGGGWSLSTGWRIWKPVVFHIVWFRSYVRVCKVICKILFFQVQIWSNRVTKSILRFTFPVVWSSCHIGLIMWTRRQWREDLSNEWASISCSVISDSLRPYGL